MNKTGKIKRVALITGANRGIGYETAKLLAEQGIMVLIGSRKLADAIKVVDEIHSAGGAAFPIKLNITSEADVKATLKIITQKFKRLDILVNNAGVFLDDVTIDPKYGRGSAFFAKLETIRDTFEVNTLGAFRLCQAFRPLMEKNKYGRIVNVSSGMGQLVDMNGTRPAYRISKAALNAVTRIFAAEGRPLGIKVNSVCPGFVRTRMGGPDADLTPADGAKTVAWLATLDSKGPTGKFFRKKKVIDW